MATKQINEFPLATSADGNDILHLKTSLGIDKQLPITNFRTSLETIIKKETLLDAQNDPYLKEGDVVNLKERTAGNGGGATWDAVDITTITPNGYNIVACTGVPTLALVLRIKDKIDIKQFGATKDELSTGAIQAAFAQQETLQLPIRIPSIGEGETYDIDGQLEYYGYGIEGDGMLNSTLKSSYIGTLIKKMNSSDNGVLRDFTLKGVGATIANVIGIGADGGTKGFFNTQVKNVHFRDMEQAGEIQFSLFCKFDTLYVRNVKRGLFFVGGGVGWNNTWYNNCITFENCIFDTCDEYAIDYVGTGLAFSGSNTMQSGGDGLRIDRDTASRSDINTLDNLYFEFNAGYDIKLKDTKVSLAPIIFQGGDGTADKPDALANIYADNTLVYATGRPQSLDGQLERIKLENNSKYIAMHSELVSAKNTADATSEFVYLPDRVAEKRQVQEIVDLGTTPVAIDPIFAGSTRITSSHIQWILQAASGEHTSFESYGALESGLHRTTAVSGDATFVGNTSFTVNLGGVTYTFATNTGNGSMTIAANSATTGTTKIIAKASNSVDFNAVMS